MKAYHEYILTALRQHTDVFAIDIGTGAYLDQTDLAKLGERAAECAYLASIHGSPWNGLAKIRHTRRAVVGGVWFTVRDIETTVPCGLPRIALYTNICSF